MVRNVNTAQVFGGGILCAFMLYGLGSSLADHPIGLTMVLLNSVVVFVLGWAGMRALGDSAPDELRVGHLYFAGRTAEGFILALSALSIPFGVGQLNEPLYLAAMCILGVASVPFWWALLGVRLLPAWLCIWGVVGYALFAAGCLAELLSGRAVAIMTTPPAGIFELVVAIFLLVFGWQKSDGFDSEPLVRQEEGVTR